MIRQTSIPSLSDPVEALGHFAHPAFLPEQRSPHTALRRITGLLAVMAVLGVVAAWSPDVHATGESRVTFTVKDEAGNPVPDIEVSLQAIDKGEKPLNAAPWKAKTNKKGIATFPFLGYNAQGEGRYALAAQKEGLYIRKFRIESRQLQSGEQGRGTLIQEDESLVSPRQQNQIAPIKAKPGGTVDVDLTMAPLSSAPEPAKAPAEGAAVPAPPVEAAPADPLAKARNMTKDGKLSEAEAALKALDQTNPSAEVSFELARVYHLQNNDSEEKTALRAVVAKDPTFPKAHYQLGKMQYDEGRTAEAISEFEAELKAHPDDSDCQMGLAALYIEAGRTADAVKLYEQSVSTNPDNLDALVSLDGLYTTIGDTKKSDEVYKRILSLNPKGAEEVYYKTGSSISKRADLSDADRGRAAAAFRKAVELNPKFAKAHRELAYALVGMGKMDEAKTHFKAYLDLEPGAKDAATIRSFLQGG